MDFINGANFMCWILLIKLILLILCVVFYKSLLMDFINVFNGVNFVVCFNIYLYMQFCICPWRGDVLPMGPSNNGGNFVAD